MSYLEKYKEILENLILYTPENKKVRYGRKWDGGYVIIDGYKYDHFVSAGIANDVSFEIDFCQNHPYIVGSAFDKTVDRLPELPNNINFYKKFIGITNDDKFTNIQDILENFNDVFIKMDIEGNEWEWVNDDNVSFKNVKQFVFEGHAMFPHLLSSGTVAYHCMGFEPDTFTDLILRGLKKINKTHYLVHFHENIYGPFVKIQENEYPAFSELTFIRKDCIIKGFNTDDIPVPNLDCPSWVEPYIEGTIIDRPLNFWPFKH